MLELLVQYVTLLGLSGMAAYVTVRVASVGIIIILCILADFVARRVIVKCVERIISRTRTSWDDAVLERKVFSKLSHLAPGLVVYLMASEALVGYESVSSTVMSITLIYLVVVLLLVIDSFLSAVVDIYRSYEVSKNIPIKGFIQVFKIIVFFLGAIVVVSIVLGKTPLYILSGLGALTAVLMLVFKDSILGFVAGIQLITNRMIATGDWVEVPKYGADGDVLEITLSTVKVQNFDKTITTVPTYALISGSFKNWRGMSESDGRRIKRSVYIDIGTIKLCTPEMLERFSKIQYISDYIASKEKEVGSYNTSSGVDKASPVNGRSLTNVGTFRAYMLSYLRNHPMIHSGMTLLVRQLAPTDKGLPIEIYVFSKDKDWVNYEDIQSDIFDHLLAVLHEFDLRAFQSPSGSDLESLVAR